MKWEAGAVKTALKTEAKIGLGAAQGVAKVAKFLKPAP